MTESRCIYCKKTFKRNKETECELCASQLKEVISSLINKYSSAITKLRIDKKPEMR